MKTKQTTFLLHINGGLGKCIMATAVIESYKTANPEQKIVVVSGYPEVFVHNPAVDKNFSFATPYLWQDYYSREDVRVFAEDPYFTQSWIKNERKHLIDVWCEEIGVPSVQKTPLLFFSGPEVDELNAMIKVDKPLMIVQSTGGVNASARAWTRNPPYAELEEYLAQFAESHYVLHLAVPETPHLTNVHQRIENLNRRQAMCLVRFSHSFVGIDSFGMHVRASGFAAGPTTIFFPLEESVQRLGYDRFVNVTPRVEVQQMLKSSQDYFATMFKHSIDSVGENCPVPVGIKWFNLDKIGMKGVSTPVPSKS